MSDEAGPPRRIAYVVSRFPLLSETFILREIEALADRGWEITLIPLLREESRVRHPESARWERIAWFTPLLSPTIVWSNLRAAVTRPRVYLGLWRDVLLGTWRCSNYFTGALGVFPKSVHLAERIRRSGVRHVHAHYLSHPTVAAMVMAELAGVGYSVTAHAHDIYVHQDMLREKVRRARFVATISEFNARLLAKEVGEETAKRVRVVRCGVHPDMFSPSAPPPPSPFRIVAVASLQPYKGLTYLIQACALLRERGLNFECRIVGDGELRAKLTAEIARRGLQHCVQLVGPLPQQAVAREIARAHVLSIPSIVTENGKMEGIPIVAMEALASCRPVVATRISGIPELVQHDNTGILVEPEDPVGLASALHRLAASPELAARLAANGRRHVEREFNLGTSVRTLEQCFEGVLRGAAIGSVPG